MNCSNDFGEFFHDFGEFVRVVDSFQDCNYLYGGCDYEITDEDIELLKSGKIINFSVNDEYGCTLSYRKGESNE